VRDAQLCLQAESWNCGVWSTYVTSRYITAVVEHVNQSDAASFFFQPWTAGDDFTVLDAHSTTSQRHQNRAFAGELRSQYSTLLADAQASGRLLYTHDDAARMGDDSDESDLHSSLADRDESVPDSPLGDLDTGTNVVRAGTAVSAVRRRRFIERPLSELVWIDLTDGMGTVEVEDEEEIEQTYDDLCDQYIEFRDDNANNSCAAALRYSLPAKLQSEELWDQIVAFREYRRQRFSLFRKGPLVEESTISGNISALLRFLGYLHYKQTSEVENAALDMSVFALPNISFLHLRDPLLDQLRNLRSQAESYSMTQKKYEKVHPQWCSWQELQVAREKCRSAFDKLPVGGGVAYLLHLREVCLLGFFSICPPPRCSIVRLLEWDRTLIQDTKQRWVVDLTDISHAASRHKTHKRKGAMLLPLPKALYPYLTRLRELVPRGDGPVFPARLLSRRTSTSSSLFLGPTPFTSFVKTTFRKYTDTGKGPNPSLLRSIFTTWLYGLRYDTEDSFLQEIKMSSAKWKAHTELVAGTVYNKELIYQQQQFAQLLIFCESYSERYAYDRSVSVPSPSEKAAAEEALGQRRSRRKRNREVVESKESQVNESAGGDDEEEYVVEALLRIRENDKGDKQVLVRWEGYRRETWEPYESIKQQLPDMMAALERGGPGTDAAEEEKTVSEFLSEFIARQRVDRAYRWRPDRLNVLELAAADHRPPIKLTAEELRRRIMAVVNEA
jgi:integrase